MTKKTMVMLGQEEYIGLNCEEKLTQSLNTDYKKNFYE
jgi:hypothetical protein